MRLLWLKALGMTIGFAPLFRQRVARDVDVDPNIVLEVTRARDHLRRIRQEMGLRPLPDQEPCDPKLFLEMAKLWMPEIFHNVQTQYVTSTSRTSTLLQHNVSNKEAPEDIFDSDAKHQALRDPTALTVPHQQCVPSRFFEFSPVLKILPSGTGSMTPQFLKQYQNVHVQRPLDHMPPQIMSYHFLGNQDESNCFHPFNVQLDFSRNSRNSTKFVAVLTLRPRLCIQKAQVGGDVTPIDEGCAMGLAHSRLDAARFGSHSLRLLPPPDEFHYFPAIFPFFRIFGVIIDLDINLHRIFRIRTKLLISLKASGNPALMLLNATGEREGSLAYVVDIDHPRKRRMLSTMASFSLSYRMGRKHATTRRQSAQAAARILGEPAEPGPAIQEEQDEDEAPPSTPSSVQSDDVEDALEEQGEEASEEDDPQEVNLDVALAGRAEGGHEAADVQEAANILYAAMPHPEAPDDANEGPGTPRPSSPRPQLMDLNADDNDGGDENPGESPQGHEEYPEEDQMVMPSLLHRGGVFLMRDQYRYNLPRATEILQDLMAATRDQALPQHQALFDCPYQPNGFYPYQLEVARFIFWNAHVHRLPQLLREADRANFLTLGDLLDLQSHLQQGGIFTTLQKEYLQLEYARLQYSRKWSQHFTVNQFLARCHMFYLLKTWDCLHTINPHILILEEYRGPHNLYEGEQDEEAAGTSRNTRGKTIFTRHRFYQLYSSHALARAYRLILPIDKNKLISTHSIYPIFCPVQNCVMKTCCYPDQTASELRVLVTGSQRSPQETQTAILQVNTNHSSFLEPQLIHAYSVCFKTMTNDFSLPCQPPPNETQRPTFSQNSTRSSMLDPEPISRSLARSRARSRV